VYPAMVGPAVCDDIIARGNELPLAEGPGPLYNNRKGVRYTDPSYRHVQCRWFIGPGHIPNLMHALFRMANAEWQYVVTTMDPVQFATYERGDFFEWHSDFLMIKDMKEFRKVSVIVQLSEPDAYEGGQLEFMGPDGENWIPEGFKPRGSLCVFASRISHRITPVKSGKRQSLITWMKGPPFR